jgi:hypothetical protein
MLCFITSEETGMSSRITVTRLLTRKDDVGSTMIGTFDRPTTPADGEAILRLASFSLTTNNITYAAFGDAMNYWDFFPTGQAGFGHMPVWGFADVVASSVPGVEPGERFYGYFPIASHIVMRPERVSERGFYDGAEHRRALVSAYNQYARCSADPAYRPELESLQALYRPLFLTSFMLADFLSDNSFFGAKRLVFSSASAKTAYGAAFCLRNDAGVETIGLTSARNATFVAGLGCYASTLTYDALETLDAAVPTLYVDFAGDNALRARIHRHFGAALVHDCYVGSASNQNFLQPDDLPGPKPQFFFAPVQIKKRNADWGAAEVTSRYNAMQTRFFDHVSNVRPPWIDIVESAGLDEAARIIAELASSGGDPAQGHIIRLG